MSLSQAEKNVFGAEAEAHPVTGMALEKGHGALHPDAQAHIHCNYLEQVHGKAHADEMRAKLKKHIEDRDHPKPAEIVKEPVEKTEEE